MRGFRATTIFRPGLRPLFMGPEGCGTNYKSFCNFRSGTLSTTPFVYTHCVTKKVVRTGLVKCEGVFQLGTQAAQPRRCRGSSRKLLGKQRIMAVSPGIFRKALLRSMQLCESSQPLSQDRLHVLLPGVGPPLLLGLGFLLHFFECTRSSAIFLVSLLLDQSHQDQSCYSKLLLPRCCQCSQCLVGCVSARARVFLCNGFGMTSFGVRRRGARACVCLCRELCDPVTPDHRQLTKAPANNIPEPELFLAPSHSEKSCNVLLQIARLFLKIKSFTTFCAAVSSHKERTCNRLEENI